MFIDDNIYLGTVYRHYIYLEMVFCGEQLGVTIPCGGCSQNAMIVFHLKHRLT